MQLLSDVLLMFGGLQIVAGVGLSVMDALKRRGCVRLEGTVVDRESYLLTGSTPYYTHIAEYVSPDGQRHRVKDRVGLKDPLPTDGTVRRTVWHDAALPTRSFVEVGVSRQFRFLPLVGVVLVGLGLATRLGLLK